MTDRDKLIELVDKAKDEYANDVTDHTETDYIVECLLNNGIIVPPCKVGDVVYKINGSRTEKFKVARFIISSHGIRAEDLYGVQVALIDDFGNTVFLTKEEAEDTIQYADKELKKVETENDNLKNDELPRCKDALRRANEIGIELQAENERLKKAIQVQEIMFGNQDYTIKRAKAEAYKKCIEKVKEIMHKYCGEITEEDLDNLLKELVGENKGIDG